MAAKVSVLEVVFKEGILPPDEQGRSLMISSLKKERNQLSIVEDGILVEGKVRTQLVPWGNVRTVVLG